MVMTRTQKDRARRGNKDAWYRLNRPTPAIWSVTVATTALMVSFCTLVLHLQWHAFFLGVLIGDALVLGWAYLFPKAAR